MRLNAQITPPASTYKRVAPMSYQEMMIAPAYMQQRHEAANAQLLEDEEGLQFDYLQKDDPIVRKRVKEYQDRLTDLSTKLAKSGVGGIPIRQELMKYKKDFIKESGQQGILGQAQQNYKDATTQWQEWKKANPKASQQYQQKAKQHFYSKYEGMQDEDGNYRGFTPGDLTGEIDIAKDAVEYFDNAGYTQDQKALLGKVAPDIQWIQKHDPKTGATYMGALITTPGVAGSDNARQLEAGLDELSKQYTDPTTNRGLYGKIAGKSQEEMLRTLQNTARLMHDQKGGQAPRTSLQGSFVKPNAASNKTKINTPNKFGVYPELFTDPKAQEELIRQNELVSSAIIGDKFDPKNLKVDNYIDKVDDFLESTPAMAILDDIKLVNPVYWEAKGAAKLFTDWSTKSKQKKVEAVWEASKIKYKNIYDATHGKKSALGDGYEGDGGFWKAVVETEQLKTAMTEPAYNLGISKPMEKIYSKTIDYVNPKSNKAETFFTVDSDGDQEFYSKKEIQELVTDSGMSDADFPTLVDKDGNFYIQLYPGKSNKPQKFMLNPKALSTGVKKDWDLVQGVKTDFLNLGLTEKEIAQVNKPILIGYTPTGESEFIDVEINPNNPLDRKIYQTVGSVDDTGKFIITSKTPINLSNLYEYGLNGLKEELE